MHLLMDKRKGGLPRLLTCTDARFFGCETHSEMLIVFEKWGFRPMCGLVRVDVSINLLTLP
jgi:hypothetical protein